MRLFNVIRHYVITPLCLIIDDTYIILVIYLNLIIILHVSKYQFKNTSNEFHDSNVDPDADFIRLVLSAIKLKRGKTRIDSTTIFMHDYNI